MKIKYKLLLTVLIANVWAFYSCKENVIIDNVDLVPVVDNINTFFTDTSTILTKTSIKDSFVTSGRRNMVLGNMQDPSFGNTECGFALDFTLIQPNYNLSFDTLHTADSAILYIPYSGFYGNKKNSIPQTVEVFRLIDTLPSDTMYNNQAANYDLADLVGQRTYDFAADFDDTIKLNNVVVEPGIYIKLSPAFAQSLVNLNKTDAFKNYNEFRNWLKGFYIKVNNATQSNNLAYFNIANARISLYYRATSKTTNLEDTFYTTFPVVQAYCKNYNYIQRNYSGSFVEPYINTTNTTDSVCLVQNEPGLITEIRIPYKSYYANNVINKAELLLNELASDQPQYDSLFAKPVLFQILLNHNDGIGDVIPTEYLAWGSTNGTYSKVLVNGDSVNQYRINITKSLQKSVITGSDLVIKVFGARDEYLAKNRVVLAGSNHSKYKSKLNVIFTKIKK